MIICLGKFCLNVVQARIDYVLLLPCVLQVSARFVERDLQLSDFFAQFFWRVFEPAIMLRIGESLVRWPRHDFGTRLGPSITLRRHGRNLGQRTGTCVELALPGDSLLKSENGFADSAPAI